MIYGCFAIDFEEECTMEMSCGIQSAAGALFGQFEGDSVFEREMEVDSSCFSLGWMT